MVVLPTALYPPMAGRPLAHREILRKTWIEKITGYH